MPTPLTLVILLLMFASTDQHAAPASAGMDDPDVVPEAAVKPFQAQPVAKFEYPWAIEFLPDGRMLVTERIGRLQLVTREGESRLVEGTPQTDFGGQGGFGDVALHPKFTDNQLIYFSYVEAGSWGRRGAVVARAKLLFEPQDRPRLEEQEIIWRQEPKVTGRGHFAQRVLFGPQGYLWISSGERQKFDPAQDLESNLGKIIRLHPDGTIPTDNPFAATGGVSAQVWSYGHRNPLGIAFDGNDRLWVAEMGPAHGDELNLIQRGANYGYPLVSNGNHYDGRPIPHHRTRPDLEAPKTYWVPSIAPSSLLIYSGELFPQWQGSALIGGLVSQTLVRVGLQDGDVRELERFAMGARIRAVQQGPYGAVWLLEDGNDGRLIRLTPKP